MQGQMWLDLTSRQECWVEKVSGPCRMRAHHRPGTSFNWICFLTWPPEQSEAMSGPLHKQSVNKGASHLPSSKQWHLFLLAQVKHQNPASCPWAFSAMELLLKLTVATEEPGGHCPLRIRAALSHPGETLQP